MACHKCCQWLATLAPLLQTVEVVVVVVAAAVVVVVIAVVVVVYVIVGIVLCHSTNTGAQHLE